MARAASRKQDEHEPRSIRDLAGVDPALARRNVAYLGGSWLTIAAALVVAARRPRWYVIVAAMVVISGRQHALLNVEHECIHNMLVPGGKRRNDRIGRWACAGPCGSPYRTSKEAHLLHHRLLGSNEDPDHELHAGEFVVGRRSFRRHLVSSALGGHAVRSLVRRGSGSGTARPADRGDIQSIVIMQGSLFAVTTALLGPWVYPMVWALPLATLTSFLHVVRSYVEHGLADDEAEHQSRLVTTTSSPVERWWIAPYNMNFHAEHHLYPYVPAFRLPEVRKRLTDGSEPTILRRHSYLGTLVRHYRSLPT